MAELKGKELKKRTAAFMKSFNEAKARKEVRTAQKRGIASIKSPVKKKVK